MRIAEKTARILLTVIGFFGLAVFFLPKIGISVDVVMSGSMEPTLKTGGIVFTDTKRTEPSVGDIVTFRNAQGKVSHRVVAKQKQSYVTKGDANNIPVRQRANSHEDDSRVAERRRTCVQQCMN